MSSYDDRGRPHKRYSQMIRSQERNKKFGQMMRPAPQCFHEPNLIKYPNFNPRETLHSFGTIIVFGNPGNEQLGKILEVKPHKNGRLAEYEIITIHGSIIDVYHNDIRASRWQDFGELLPTIESKEY